MALRSVDQDFWADEWVQGLEKDCKLLFLYLLTNPKHSILGIYKLNKKVIEAETGIDRTKLDGYFEKFNDDHKVFYFKNEWIFVVNYLKYQTFNLNMKKNVVMKFDTLPVNVKIYCINSPVMMTALVSLQWFEMFLESLRKVHKKPVSYNNDSEPFRNHSVTIGESLGNHSTQYNTIELNEIEKQQQQKTDKNNAAVVSLDDFNTLALKHKFLDNIVNDFLVDRKVLYMLCNQYGVQRVYLSYCYVMEKEAKNPAGMFVSSFEWDLIPTDFQQKVMDKIRE